MRTALDAILQRRGCGEYSYVGVLQKRIPNLQHFARQKMYSRKLLEVFCGPKKVSANMCV